MKRSNIRFLIEYDLLIFSVGITSVLRLIKIPTETLFFTTLSNISIVLAIVALAFVVLNPDTLDLSLLNRQEFLVWRVFYVAGFVGVYFSLLPEFTMFAFLPSYLGSLLNVVLSVPILTYQVILNCKSKL